MDRAIIDLLENRDLGASALLAKFTDILPQLSEKMLFTALAELKQAFPLMAVWSFTETYFQQHKPDRETIDLFYAQIKREKDQVIQGALDQLKPYKTFLTLSHSSLVESFLLAKSQQRPIRVICSRSLPANEGIHLSENLERVGVQTECVEDWLLVEKLASADAILIGADWVTDTFIINKWGSLQIIEMAQTFGKPVYVLAESFKHISGLDPPLDVFYQDWSEGHVNRFIQVFEIIPRSSQITLI